MKLDLILKASLRRQKATTESPFSVNYPFRDPLQFFFVFSLQSCFSNSLFVQFLSEYKIKNIFVGLICIRYLICMLLINAFIAPAYQETPSWLLECRNYDAACISKRRLKVVIMCQNDIINMNTTGNYCWFFSLFFSTSSKKQMPKFKYIEHAKLLLL